MNAQPLHLQSQDKFTTQETVVRVVASAALAVCCTATWPPAWAHAAALCYQHPEALATISAPSHLPLAPALLNEQTFLSNSSDPLCSAAAPATTNLPDEAEEVSNEYIVAEAWQVVNERFFDARHHKWSPDAWLVVYTVAKDPGMQKGIFAKSPPVTRVPLMIFVNEHTASASEIGLIQSVFELSDGSGVILTVGKYVTPCHQEIDENGIFPDFQDLPGKF